MSTNIGRVTLVLILSAYHNNFGTAIDKLFEVSIIEFQ